MCCARDMSGATWGGSSCEEEEEEEVTSFAGLDETVEDLDHNETLGTLYMYVLCTHSWRLAGEIFHEFHTVPAKFCS